MNLLDVSGMCGLTAAENFTMIILCFYNANYNLRVIPYLIVVVLNYYNLYLFLYGELELLHQNCFLLK